MVDASDNKLGDNDDMDAAINQDHDLLLSSEQI
jgi:hypothetical protein